MHQKADGMNYAPQGQVRAVCAPGEFRFAAIGLDHGHINGQCNGLIEAGGQLVAAYDPDAARLSRFCAGYPGIKVARSELEILDDPSIHLVASACVPSDRTTLGLRVLGHGKDYFADKPSFTTTTQLEAARQQAARTGQIWAVYYAERLHVEAAVLAEELIQQGAIGRVVQVIGLGPHRLNAASRPDWFWNPARYGGILVDLGSHQIEQFLHYAGAQSARVLHSKVGNYANPNHPAFEDFGDATLLADTGASFYFRVDWFTPAGLGAWGDGRTIILGTEGYLELRKYVDIARDTEGDQVYLVDHQSEQRRAVHGQTGFPYFGRLIRDCLDRTETAMNQAHTFLASDLALQAQAGAMRLGRPSS